MSEDVKPLTQDELARIEAIGMQHGDYRRLLATARAGLADSDVKAGMTRRMNVMHAALVEVWNAFAKDPFGGGGRPYLAERGIHDLMDGERIGVSQITAGMLVRVKHAISEGAYDETRPQSNTRVDADG